MPRRGWRAVEVPEGWLQVLRGPRPASVQWPRAAPNLNRESHGKKVPKVDLPQRPVPPRPTRPARSPDLVSAETAQEVQRLENAVSALGEDNPLAKPFVSALKAAKSKLEAPIGERLDSCQRFLERARKRVTSAESAIAEAVAERDRLVAEFAEGEKRMERLREEARAAPPPRDVVGDEFLDDVAQMRQEILELRRFRDRFPASALRGALVLLFWRIFRQCRRIRTNSRHGCQTGTQISGVLWRRRRIQRSSVSLRTCCPKQPPNCPSWRARIARSGADNRSFRTLLKGVQGRNSVYGYRGVRVGEASNPGPPKSQFQRRGPVFRPHRSRSRVEPTIYSSDDDDEPLVPVLADSMSTVPASIGALRDVGVEIREVEQGATRPILVPG